MKFSLIKRYKGIKTSQSQVLSEYFYFSYGNLSKEGRLKKGETWMTFANKTIKTGNWGFGGACHGSRLLEDNSKIKDYEDSFFSIKDKQGIIGRITRYRGPNYYLEGAEITLKGEGMEFYAKTDNDGLFYFGVPPGSYQINIKITPFVFDIGSHRKIKQIIENFDIKPKPESAFFSYSVELKENEFSYEELETDIINN